MIGKMGKDSPSSQEPTQDAIPKKKEYNMASRKTPKSVPAKAVPAKAAPIAVTPVRNSAIPPKAVVAAAPAKKTMPLTHESIAIRAFEIWRSTGGSAEANWVQAERELKGL
jgi:hypothetical protein